MIVKEGHCLKAMLIFCYSQASQFPSGSARSTPCPHSRAATLCSLALINQLFSLSLLPHSSLLTVHAAGAKVKDLEDEADRLLEKLQPIRKLQDNLRRNISQIKELINQARKQANSVSW